MRRIFVIATVAGALALTMVACGDDDGDRSCEAICLDAQNQDCTSIDDCNEFCSVGRSLSGKASCGSEWDAYDNCANNTSTCTIESTCSSYEDDFFDCVTPFCLANTTDSDCIAAANM